MRRYGLLLAAAALALSLAPCSSGAPAAAPISVMSFNIRYGTANDGENSWPNRSTMVVNVIRTRAPDVLGVQEALRFQLDEITSAVPEYEEIGVGREDGWEAGEYSAILYRSDRYEAEDEGTFWFSDTPEVPGSTSWGNRITRICTWARIRRLETDERFYVYNLHLDHESQPSRERSAALLASRLAAHAADVPVLLLGDFNAGERNAAIQFLIGGIERLAADTASSLRSPRLRDTYRAIHTAAVDSVGTFHGFRGDRSGEQIDWILASDHWEVLDAAIVRTNDDGRYPSDHFPVTALVRLR